MNNSELASVLKLNNYKRDLKEAAILDYYVAGYWLGLGVASFLISPLGLLKRLVLMISNNQLSSLYYTSFLKK